MLVIGLLGDLPVHPSMREKQLSVKFLPPWVSRLVEQCYGRLADVR